MAVFDIEADGFNPTKIHCLSMCQDGETNSYTSYEEMKQALLEADCLIGHNIIRYDIPVCERILGIDLKDKKIVDTLPLSWYIYIERNTHGLEDWAKEFGLIKPPIEDWDNLPVEEYIDRCESDVEINQRLWDMQSGFLRALYNDEEGVARIIDYLNFKMQCARLQEVSRWKLDETKCMDALVLLRQERDQKKEELAAVMPEVPTYSERKRPVKMYKQNGEITALGVKWLALLESEGLPDTHTEPVKVITGYKPPNPNSSPQIKDWLYSIGWEPDEFKYVRNKETKEVRSIPQINKQDPGEDGVCESIRRLFQVEPNLEALDGLSIINHRIGLLSGFLRDVDDDGYLRASIAGLTNTLRFKHKVLVNLPGIHRPYGEIIRGCLIAPKGYELCGSDMSSLEDRTKQHWMHPHDPDYVDDMQSEGFDPHLDIAQEAKLMNDKQVQEYRETGAHNSIRRNAKVVNYSCTYGAGPPTIARSTGIPLKTAEVLHKAYWDRNWAIEAIARDCVTREVFGTKWLYNPLSRLWYSLRHDKDKFSTLNQGSGVWCFDLWVKHILSIRPQLTGQFHDEVILTIKLGNREKCKRLLNWAMEKTNEELRLNVQLGNDIQFGNTYAEIH